MKTSFRLCMLFCFLAALSGCIGEGLNPKNNSLTSTTGGGGGTNNGLSALSLSSGNLSPTFANSTFAYSGNVANAVGSITVTPTASQPGATITVNGVAVASGSASASIPLTVGINTITIVVTSTTGVVETYTLSIGRSLSAGENVLHNFTGSSTAPIDGSEPSGNLTLAPDGHTLYGMTKEGGANGNGTIFTLQADGTGYSVIHSFNSSDNNGFEPEGDITVSSDGSTLYGATSEGGTSFDGVVFKMNSDGTQYTVLHTFSGNDGEEPDSSPILVGSTLYGMTTDGGPSNGEGTIYQMSAVDGSGFTLLHTFQGGHTDGEDPGQGNTLLASGSTLYGMTTEGGTGSDGVIFSIGMDGSGFQILHDFTGTGSDGQNPLGGLILLGNTLYGTAEEGGVDSDGIIFSINTNGTGYSTIHSFNGTTDGSDPEGTLAASADGTTLYGFADNGGAPGDAGTIFSIRPDGSQFTVLHSFLGTSADGGFPFSGHPVLIGNSIYGMTNQDGLDSDGAIFEFGSPMKMFVSNSTYSGSFGGPVSADALCASDSNTPSDGQVYKALLVDGVTRTACTSANCTSGGFSENHNWVLAPGTLYVRSDGVTSIAQTTADGVFSFPLTDNAFSAVSMEVWTGLNGDWTTSADNCTSWSSNSSSVMGAFGQDASSTSDTSIEGTPGACNQSLHLYCVQQL
jgi:uncharacterized repeat protein (TIGR03803 family)